MILALVLGSRCNAACGHCSTSCGPERTEALDEASALRLMSEAAGLSHGEPLKFALTGGEPFLDFALLLRLAAHGKRLGAEVTCVSNAYWATSPEKARNLLSAAKDAGLTMLAVSASRFHQQFVKIKRVEKALQAAREVGLHCTLKYARVASDAMSEDAIRSWAFSFGAQDVQVFSVMPHLREGASLPDDEYLRSKGLPTGGCPAAILTVRENGEAFTCCSPGSNIPFFSLGNTRDEPLSEISDRFYLGGMQQILRDQGPIHFAREAIARGLGDRLRDSYVSVCDLCTQIGNDPQLAAVARDAASAHEIRQLDGLLESMVETTPGP